MQRRSYPDSEGAQGLPFAVYGPDGGVDSQVCGGSYLEPFPAGATGAVLVSKGSKPLDAGPARVLGLSAPVCILPLRWSAEAALERGLLERRGPRGSAIAGEPCPKKRLDAPIVDATLTPLVVLAGSTALRARHGATEMGLAHYLGLRDDQATLSPLTDRRLLFVSGFKAESFTATEAVPRAVFLRPHVALSSSRTNFRKRRIRHDKGVDVRTVVTARWPASLIAPKARSPLATEAVDRPCL